MSRCFQMRLIIKLWLQHSMKDFNTVYMVNPNIPINSCPSIVEIQQCTTRTCVTTHTFLTNGQKYKGFWQMWNSNPHPVSDTPTELSGPMKNGSEEANDHPTESTVQPVRCDVMPQLTVFLPKLWQFRYRESASSMTWTFSKRQRSYWYFSNPHPPR